MSGKGSDDVMGRSATSLGPAAPPAPEPSADASRVLVSPLTSDPMTPGTFPFPRWFGLLAALCAVCLVPWIVYLAVELPTRHQAANYDITWVGFDCVIFVALLATAVAVCRHSTWTEPLATAAAVMLLCDVWFDVSSADGSFARMGALVSAACIEIPLAVICGWVAHNTERLRRHAYRRLWSRATAAERHAVNLGVPVPEAPDADAATGPRC